MSVNFHLSMTFGMTFHMLLLQYYAGHGFTKKWCSEIAQVTANLEADHGVPQELLPTTDTYQDIGENALTRWVAILLKV